MKTLTSLRNAGWALLALSLFVGAMAAAGEAKAPAARLGSHTLSGPYTHENLSIFLIHGPDRLKGKNYLTLQEALSQKKVVVHETKEVNRLTIENVSADAEIFVLSGDIIKGGQQDRIIAFDVILPPKSDKVAVTVYCVEQGRWSQRGAEPAATFAASTSQVPSKSAKLAVQGAAPAGSVAAGRIMQRGAQVAVWREVALKQRMLSMNVGKAVQAAQSETSLQLSLEDKELLKAVDAYTKKLSPILKDKKDAIGFAFAINGQVNSADVYASNTLFQKVWPKLLASAVVEAIAEKRKDKKFEPVKAEAFKNLIQDADKAEASNKDVTPRTRMVKQETKENVLFETRDQQNKGVPVRKNYIKK
ncbi:MAG TPA: DUF6569 family protein [Gemmataceae bacterium]|nr:DUF6569 family protein [Gemmataceae bacterium]